jgi:hypothetical protein
LLEVVRPLELNRLTDVQLAIALDTADVGEVGKANPLTFRRRDRSPALFAVPERNRSSLGHGSCRSSRSSLVNAEKTS